MFLRQRSFKDFSNFAFELQTDATAKLNPARIREYLEIIRDFSGTEMCTVVFHYVIIVLGKYLQMMVAYHVYNEELDGVTDEFNHFNQNYDKLVSHFTFVTGMAFEAGNIPNPNILKSKLRPMATQLQLKDECLGATSIEIDPDVSCFLRDLKLTELSGIFKREQLTMKDIVEMNNNDLLLIGVEKHKQRKAILKACEDLEKKLSEENTKGLPNSEKHKQRKTILKACEDLENMLSEENTKGLPNSEMKSK